MDNKDRLSVLWTSGDKDVAEQMVFMYSFFSKKYGWWKEVDLIIWGSATRLISEDTGLQDYLAKLIKAGVNVMACKMCSDNLGVSDILLNLGVDVKYMGEPLTKILKEDGKLITI